MAVKRRGRLPRVAAVVVVDEAARPRVAGRLGRAKGAAEGLRASSRRVRAAALASADSGTAAARSPMRVAVPWSR